MAITDSDRVRSMLGEEVPVGGNEGDTLFTEEKLADLIVAADGDLEAAASAGWRLKAAHYADLVDVSEGNSTRAMSDLHKNALAMAKYYAGEIASGALGSRNVVIGEIARRRY